MKDLTSGNIYKNFILFAIPMVLSGMLSQAQSTINTVVAGQYLGDGGLAAIGASSPLITFISAVCWGAGNGFSVHFANLFGAKRYRDIKQEVCNTYFWYSIALLLVSIFSILFCNPIFDLLRVDPVIRKDAETYFSIYMAGFLPIVLSFNGVYVLNAFGSSTFPFLMSLLSTVLNVGISIVTIVQFGMGIEALAVAAVLSSTVTTLCYIFKIRECFREMGVWKEPVGLSLRRVGASARYWVPTMFQQSVMYLATLCIAPMVNAIGSAASASYTVVLRIYNINASIYQNSARTVSSYTAQCVGKGQTDKLGKGLRVGLLQGICFLALPLLCCICYPEAICRLFFQQGYEGDGLLYSVHFLQYFLPLILINLVANLFHAFYRGVAAMKPLFLATCIGSFVQITSGWILANLFGIYGAYGAWVLSWVADALFGVLLYTSQKWKTALNQTF